MSDFVKVTATRPMSEISVILAPDEWERLEELARALPEYCEWTAQPVDGQSHRSTSA